MTYNKKMIHKPASGRVGPIGRKDSVKKKILKKEKNFLADHIEIIYYGKITERKN